MRALKFFLALFLAVMLASCGGGSDSAATPESVTSALRAQAGSLAAGTPTETANQLMDWAEGIFPSFFPEHQITQTLGPFVYRHYSSGLFLGVVVTENLAFQFNGVYLLGGPWSSPTYVGQISNFPFDTGNTGGGNKTLTITVNVLGVISTINVGSVPFPTTEGEFCSGLAADTTFTQIGVGAGGTLTINSCSFSGSTGTISATLTITSPFTITVPYTITYTYQ